MRFKRSVAGLLLSVTFLFACGEEPQTEYGPVSEVNSYLSQVRQLLQALRMLDAQVAKEVATGTVEADYIVPLIRDSFRPALIDLHDRATHIVHGEKLDPLHRQLLDYLELRIKAYDTAIAGDEQNRPELFEEFSRLQTQAQELGRQLEKGIGVVRHKLP